MKLAGGQVLVDHASRGPQERLDGLSPERGIVLAPPGLVTQHLVGFLNCLEKQRIAPFVRMMLDRERAESPPDRIVFCIGRYAESLVMCQWAQAIV